MDEFQSRLSSLSEISKSQLEKILSFIPSPKYLTLENEIIKPLERICGVSWLKKNGVQKIFKLEPIAPHLPHTQVYMIYTNIKTFKKVLELIQSQLDMENPAVNQHHIICVPKSLYVFEDMLEELGLYSSVIKLYSLQWFPIHIDIGLLSLELPGIYKSLYVQHDNTLLPVFSKALWHMFHAFGKPNFFLTLGQNSNSIYKQFNEFYKSDHIYKGESDFGGIILMDRNMDYQSTLLTPGTYTALLKEIYNVHCGVCEQKNSIEDKHDSKYIPIINKPTVQFPLDSGKDGIYKDIKNRYFTEVTNILSQITKKLRSESESSKDMALDEMKKYVKTQLQAITSKKKNLTNHLIAAETIINILGHKFENQMEIERNILQNKNKTANLNYLEEILQSENDPFSSLKLMCLIASTQKISESDLKNFLHKYFLEFGFDFGYIYSNLIKANFIQVNASKLIKIPALTNNFLLNANKLKQIPADPDKIDLKEPKCCSYVFGGSYIPLVTQIVSLLICNTPLEEIRNKLGSLGILEMNSSGYPLNKKKLLVCVVGGMSYSEVAGLNLLESLMGAKIVCFSDKYIGGNDIVEAIITI